MKRILLFFIIVLSSLATFAKAPNLNVERLFDGRYNGNRSVTVSVYKNNGNYYRGLTVKTIPVFSRK